MQGWPGLRCGRQARGSARWRVRVTGQEALGQDDRSGCEARADQESVAEDGQGAPRFEPLEQQVCLVMDALCPSPKRGLFALVGIEPRTVAMVDDRGGVIDHKPVGASCGEAHVQLPRVLGATAAQPMIESPPAPTNAHVHPAQVIDRTRLSHAPMLFADQPAPRLDHAYLVGSGSVSSWTSRPPTHATRASA